MTDRVVPSDYRVPGGVIWSPRLCLLISGDLMRTAKATIKEFGGVDTELAMTIRATYEAGQEWASGAHASDSAEDESESSQSKHDDLLTTVEAAEELGCTANNVRDLIRWEKLDAIHRGPLLFIDRAELERFKERRNAA